MKFYANLKCNHTRASFAAYADALNSGLGGEILGDVCVFAPATAFLSVKDGFALGAQNFYPCQSGAFTGEIGKAHLDEFGINRVLIGHSERRALGDEGEILQRKFNFAKQNGWEITFCVGESLADFEAGRTQEFLAVQLDAIDLNYERLIIAYEPIWAIGTGKSADAAQIEKILSFIKAKGAKVLLYGGSVSAANIAQIAKIPACDGVLVGTASWDAGNFLNLIQNAKEQR